MEPPTRKRLKIFEPAEINQYSLAGSISMADFSYKEINGDEDVKCSEQVDTMENIDIKIEKLSPTRETNDDSERANSTEKDYNEDETTDEDDEQVEEKPMEQNLQTFEKTDDGASKVKPRSILLRKPNPILSINPIAQREVTKPQAMAQDCSNSKSKPAVSNRHDVVEENWQVEYLEEEESNVGREMPPLHRAPTATISSLANKNIAEESKKATRPTVPLENLVELLRFMLPHPWVVSLGPLGLQVMHVRFGPSSAPYVTAGVMVDKKGRITVTALGRMVSPDHKFFTQLDEVITMPSGLVRVNYILQVIHQLVTNYNPCWGIGSSLHDVKGSSSLCMVDAFNPNVQRFRSRKCSLLVGKRFMRCAACWSLMSSESSKSDGERKREMFEAMHEKLKKDLVTRTQIVRKVQPEEPPTQEFMMRSMGLTRTNGLERNVRRSKRERRKVIRHSIEEGNTDEDDDKEKEKEQTNENEAGERDPELSFLVKEWTAIQNLFEMNISKKAIRSSDRSTKRVICNSMRQLLLRWRHLVRQNTGLFAGCTISPHVFYPVASMSDDKLLQFSILFSGEIRKLRLKLKTDFPYFSILYKDYIGKLSSDDTENAIGDNSQCPAE